MHQGPYKLKEAEKICADYQHLIGKPFSKGESKKVIVSSIIIAPFDEASRKRFLIYYLLFNDAQSALSFEYRGLLFSILIIGRTEGDTDDMVHEELYPWLLEQGMTEGKDGSVIHEALVGYKNQLSS